MLDCVLLSHEGVAPIRKADLSHCSVNSGTRRLEVSSRRT